MQTINQFNKTIQILQRKIAIKDATILALQQTIHESSNITILPTEPSTIILVPSSDEIDHFRSKVAKI